MNKIDILLYLSLATYIVLGVWLIYQLTKILYLKLKQSPFLHLSLYLILVLSTVYLLFHYHKADAQEIIKDEHTFPVFFSPEELNSFYGTFDEVGLSGGVEFSFHKEALKPILEKLIGAGKLFFSFPDLYLGINVSHTRSLAAYAALGIKFDVSKGYGVGAKGLFIYLTEDFSDHNFGIQTSVYTYYTFPSALILKQDFLSLYVAFKSPTMSFVKKEDKDFFDYADIINVGIFYNPKISGTMSFSVETNLNEALVAVHWSF